MKKFKNKIFLTILAIFTFFLVFILFVFNYQNYKREEALVRSNLERLHNNIWVKPGREFGQDRNNIGDSSIERDDLDKKIFMDYTVYTVLIGNDDEIIDVISHNEDESKTDKIKKVARDIIDKNEEDVIKIGNLYVNDYAYFYRVDSFVTIIDNTLIKERLVSNLVDGIILFIVLEIVVICLSRGISDYLTKPVIESFNKQKQFIADASHELKTPISVIMASADAIKITSKDKKWLNNIKGEADRMSKLVSDLLDLAKLESSNNKELYNITDISKLIEMSVLTFESLAYENGLSLDYNIEDKIMMNCNSSEIKQLVSILLDNAIKHSYKKEKVKVELFKKREVIVLKVTNKGDTIPKEDLEKIFERFYRVDKARNRNENRYGLGLAIAKGIVENHNGIIKVISNDNLTTFMVEFRR